MTGRPTVAIVADLRKQAWYKRVDGTDDVMREAADRLAELDAENDELHEQLDARDIEGNRIYAEVMGLVDVIRLCRTYMPSDAHSEEADSDCDYMMDQVLKQYGVKRSDG